jgi:dTDP-4-dehydrorhamnose reductase
MRLLVAGAGGQLGRAMQAAVPTGASIIAPAEADFDITDAAQVAAVIAASGASHLLNAAAYTAVDKAESDADAARRINVDAVAVLAEAARAAGIKFIHVSTDFVFDGRASTPYAPEAATNPLGVYGVTKRDGELAAGADALIVRTAWVYAAVGGNFVKTMLRLMAERDELRVVADQIGTPTHAASLAGAIWQLAMAGATGIYHWTDSGAASWYDFAVAIAEEALALGLLNRAVPIIPIRTVDYPTPAVRPSYSVLDKSSSFAIIGPARHWRCELRDCLKDMQGQSS